MSPLRRGRSNKTIGANIKELHTGRTYARTKAKYGAKRANKQAVAIAYRKAGRSRKKNRRRK